MTESGAMVARDSAVQMTTNMQGGLGSALKRKLIGGESLTRHVPLAVKRRDVRVSLMWCVRSAP